MIQLAKARVRSVVPMAARMRMAAWMTRQRWLPVPDHLVMGLVRDLQHSDPKAFHKFAWANHLMGYARWYDSEEELFDPARMQASRIELVRDLESALDELAVDPEAVRSVLDVGCSQGYLLRHLETSLLTGARELIGIDIDRPAVEKGSRLLSREHSRIRLVAGDMEQIDTLVGPRRFDVVLAAGVLSYLNEADAFKVVSQMLARTGRILALAGLACVRENNNGLDASELSPSHDGQWVHNFEAMVVRAGGRVVRSRWEGAKLFNLQTICFVFAVPNRQ